MSRTCQHIQDDGLHCTNPAMYRRQVCYHHWRILRPNPPVNDVAYVPPTFDSEASVSLVCANILRSLFAGKMTPKFAQSAMTAVRETAKSIRLQGKMGKAGNRSATRLTPFMADYFSTLDQMQSKSAAAYPDPQPLLYPATFAEVPEHKDEETDDIEAKMTNMGKELNDVDTGFQARVSAVPTAEPPSLKDDSLDLHRTADNRGRAGLQPRVADPKKGGASAPVTSAAAPEGSPWRQPWVSVTSTSKAPAGATDSAKKPPQPAPLSAHQAKLLKKILRRGPKHPQFHLAARLLDRQIAGGTS